MLDYLKLLLRTPLEDQDSTPPATPLPEQTSATITPLTPTPLPPKVGDMGDRAEAAIDELADTLNDWFETDLQVLYDSWHRFEQSNRDNHRLKELFHAAHNLSGMGETYGQSDIGRICRSLCRLIDHGNPRANIMLAGLHIDACRAICTSVSSTGDAGKICTALEAEVAKLQAA